MAYAVQPALRGITPSARSSSPATAAPRATRHTQTPQEHLVSSTFAFTVRPRARLGEDVARGWSPLGRVPHPVYDRGRRRLPLRPVSMAGIHLGGARVGHVVLVPF